MVDCGCAAGDVGEIDGGDEERPGAVVNTGLRIIASRRVNRLFSVTPKKL